MTTIGSVADLPPTLDAHQFAEIVGCSAWTVYELVKRGECPVKPLRLGRALRFPTLKVLEAIGISPDPAAEDSDGATSESEGADLRLVEPGASS
jgi:predicted DNA-binding transcriptional regulator AlpA